MNKALILIFLLGFSGSQAQLPGAALENSIGPGIIVERPLTAPLTELSTANDGNLATAGKCRLLQQQPEGNQVVPQGAALPAQGTIIQPYMYFQPAPESEQAANQTREAIQTGAITPVG